MRLTLGMWNYFHNFLTLNACQFFGPRVARVYFGHFGRKQGWHSPPPRFGLIIELMIGNDIKLWNPSLADTKEQSFVSGKREASGKTTSTVPATSRLL
jgi:hypothetical protein